MSCVLAIILMLFFSFVLQQSEQVLQRPILSYRHSLQVRNAREEINAKEGGEGEDERFLSGHCLKVMLLFFEVELSNRQQ